MERIPRPIGTTEIGRHYNKTKDKDILQELIQHVVQHYIDTGFKYCHNIMDLYSFSQYVNIDVTLIQQQMIQRSKALINLDDPESQSDHLRAVLNSVLSCALSDRNRALTQYEHLAKAQGQTYKPFISGEVNKALKLTLDTTSNLTALYKALMGNDASIVINNNNANNQNNTDNYLTIDKALTVLHQNSPKALTPGEPNPLAQGLYLEHQLGDTPEVVASKQQGLDTSKEGLSFGSMVELSDGKVDDMIDAIEGPKSHIDRRAKGLNVDLEDDDNI